MIFDLKLQNFAVIEFCHYINFFFPITMIKFIIVVLHWECSSHNYFNETNNLSIFRDFQIRHSSYKECQKKNLFIFLWLFGGWIFLLFFNPEKKKLNANLILHQVMRNSQKSIWTMNYVSAHKYSGSDDFFKALFSLAAFNSWDILPLKIPKCFILLSISV